MMTNSWISRSRTPPRKSLVLKVIKNSKQCLKKLANGKRIMQIHKTFRIARYQSSWTTETSMDMTSLATSEIKVNVVHATQFRWPRLWKQESSWSMESSHQCYLHRCSWLVTIWMKAVMADGLTLMSSCPKTVTWYQRNALLIFIAPRVMTAKIISNASQLPRLRSHTSLVEVGEIHPKRKWWRK